MSIISTFCKKGGVGKTTIIGYLAHYYAQKGNSVLLISLDDQNSIFKLFGKDGFIAEREDNFFDNYIADEIGKEDIVCEARENMYIIKTLNTDTLSLQLTLKRSEEKRIKNIILDLSQYFDYVFIDFPPSSSRLSEVVLEVSDQILLVVSLDALGIDGFKNTVQYFIDTDVDINKISYIIPNNYHPVKKAPQICYKELQEEAKIYTPKAKITTPMSDLSIIKNLQVDGVSVFDNVDLGNAFHNKNKARAKEELENLYNSMKL